MEEAFLIEPCHATIGATQTSRRGEICDTSSSAGPVSASASERIVGELVASERDLLPMAGPWTWPRRPGSHSEEDSS